MQGDHSDHNRDNQTPKRSPVPKWGIVAAVAVAFVLINMIFGSMFSGDSAQTVGYSKFLEQLEAGEVERVVLTASEVRYATSGGAWGTQAEYAAARVDDPELVNRLLKMDVPFEQNNAQNVSVLSVLISFVLPLAFYGCIIYFVVRMFKKGQGGALSFTKSKARAYTLSDVSKTFENVAGQDEAKEALREIVDYLHNPSKYRSIGAKLPKGALLVGPPGTGKTLLAQAVAGESKSPFFFVSGSAFVEMFVGTGAARVRDLFKHAQEKAPCIVFIDEIDAIGKRRDASGIGGNDEREQTLNQLLAEMDGFDPGKGVVVLAATNRPEILDKALLRPGRFDRRIAVDLPDMKGREAVLRVHAKDIAMAENIDLAAIARVTVGASGADLANIVNEAALRAVRCGHAQVRQSDLEESVETVIAGSQRRSLALPESEKCLVAYHEVGHALAASKLQNASPVRKVTIIPRTSGALGYTMQSDENEHLLISRDEMLDRLCVLTAGRAAEELVFHNYTSGAANDIEQATQLARAMVTRYGMTDAFDMMQLESGASVYLDLEGSSSCSPAMRARADDEVLRLIREAHERAAKILTDNMLSLHRAAKLLYERETLSGDEFLALLAAND